METNIAIGNYIRSKSLRKHNLHKSLIDYYSMLGYDNSDKPLYIRGVNGSKLYLHNFGYYRDNGFGYYPKDFTKASDFKFANYTNVIVNNYTDNMLHISALTKDYLTFDKYQQLGTILKDNIVEIPSIRLKITGLTGSNVKFVMPNNLEGMDYLVVTEDSVLDIKLEEYNTIFFEGDAGKYDITILQLSIFEGALMFDGLRYCTCNIPTKKKVGTVIIKYLLKSKPTEPSTNYLYKGILEQGNNQFIRLQLDNVLYSNFNKTSDISTCVVCVNDIPKQYTADDVIIGAFSGSSTLVKDGFIGAIYSIAIYEDALTAEQIAEDIDKIDPIPEDYYKCVLLPVTTGYDEYILNETITKKTSRAVFLYNDKAKVVRGFSLVAPTNNVGIQQGIVTVNGRNYATEYTVADYTPKTFIAPTKKYYYGNEKLDTTDMQVIATRFDGVSTTEVEFAHKDLTYEGFDTDNTTGVKTVIVKYRGKELGRFDYAVTNICDGNNKLMIDGNDRLILL